MNEHKFNIGDRVVFVGDIVTNGIPQFGMSATVIAYYSAVDALAVRFDDEYKLELKRGTWAVYESNLKEIEEEQEEIVLDKDLFENYLKEIVASVTPRLKPGLAKALTDYPKSSEDYVTEEYIVTRGR